MLVYAMTCVMSVDYRVSLRWLFYRLLQGFGLTKKDYNPFKRVVANFRKKMLRGWHPAILADETRQIYDPNKGSIKKTLELNSHAKVYRNYQSLVKSPDIDWVLIASRNCQHSDQAIAALQAGKDIFFLPMKIWQAL